MRLFSKFEGLVSAFPREIIETLPTRFWPFMWACSYGMRKYILCMTILTACIGAFEALLFALMGKVVDKLTAIAPQALWASHQQTLTWVVAILIGSTLIILLQTLLKHQTLAGNFPMRLRWQFHQHMLNQSMTFYQDEFAGRVSAKVMQTALAVREVWFILADIMVYVLLYFTTIVTVVGTCLSSAG